MVSIDQYNSEVQRSLLTSVLRAFLIDLKHAFVIIAKFIFARRDVDIQRRRVRLATQISAQAGRPTTDVAVEPSRLTGLMMADYLQPCANKTIEGVNDAAASTHEIEMSLDRIDYELATIRSEIAAYLP